MLGELWGVPGCVYITLDILENSLESEEYPRVFIAGDSPGSSNASFVMATLPGPVALFENPVWIREMYFFQS